jgi:hypothetical protein
MNPDLQKSMTFGNVAILPPFVLVGRGAEDGMEGWSSVMFGWHFVNHRFYMDWPGIEPTPMRLEAGC